MFPTPLKKSNIHKPRLSGISQSGMYFSNKLNILNRTDEDK